MRIRKLICALAISVFASAAFAADVTGTWLMSVDIQGQTGNPTFTLKQSGNSVTGTYKGSLGEAPVTGTVKGNDLALSYKIAAQGVELEVKYTGTLDGNNVSGKVSLGEFGEGAFKGTKQ